MIYSSPDTDRVKDLHCEQEEPGRISSVWWLTPAEREAIYLGSNILLTIHSEPIPPISLSVTEQQGIGEDGPDALERLDALTQART